MNITPTAPPPAFSGQQPTSGPDKTSGLSSDFETFLRMLTVQMQNQDPLNPVDSSDYAVQLATFSSVEQQVLTNDLLQDLNERMGGGSVQQLAGWIGMEALARAPVRFEGAPINLRPDFAESADAAILVVRDAEGNTVQRAPLTPSSDSVDWAGVDDQGMPLPLGTYRFDIESYENGALIDTRTAATYNRIEEARFEGGDVLLRLSDGSDIETSMVTGLRAPV